MLTAFELLRTAAPASVNVLLLGEAGTGKELAAAVLHELSPRAERPFVRINCAAIPAELLESELFGHHRGAFTDATSDKRGLLELTGAGTLLLDEIGEMPLVLQAKLLRVLQEREFRPLGATEAVSAKFRLVCATNVDPAEHMRIGRLRRDLFFRINTITVDLPPLRKRRRDIPLLATRFLQQYAAVYNRQPLTFAPQALRVLACHAWPGNVRELQHVVERAIILSKGPTITVRDLPDSVTQPTHQALAKVQIGGCRLEDLERQAIQQTLDLTGWNKRAAARLLGVHRPTLYNKLRKYRLWPRGSDA